MSDFDHANFFTDAAIQEDPYPYFDWVRERSPVWREPHYGVFMVTGHEEAMRVYTDPATFPDDDPPSGRFSSCNVVVGPFQRFSAPAEGDDVSDLIRKYRHELTFSDQIPSFDPPRHTDHRHLMMRLITPKNLKNNEDFMWDYADRLIDSFDRAGSGDTGSGDTGSGDTGSGDMGSDGRFEAVADFAEPFTLTVVADLEGVPEADHSLFRDRLATAHESVEHKPLEFLYARFSEYVEERRAEPRDDVLSGLANATFPDGSVPEVNDVALIAANLFAGGQETTVRMLSFALRMLAERPDLQEAVRADRDKIPNFIEETLRLESPLRTQFRMARVSTELAGVEIPAGSSLMLAPGAANRDPRLFDDPHRFDLDRVNARAHIAFGHGIHTCAGAPLARAEGRVALNRILDRAIDIVVDEAEHGPAGARRYDYLPGFFLRGLRRLHLRYTPA